MAVRIDVPVQPWSTQNVSLGGQDYEFEFKYNGREDRWRFSIRQEDTTIVSGIKVVENQIFLINYVLPLFSHGDIMCRRILKDNKQVGRNNLGLGKPYELYYYSYLELDELLNG